MLRHNKKSTQRKTLISNDKELLQESKIRITLSIEYLKVRILVGKVKTLSPNDEEDLNYLVDQIS